MLSTFHSGTAADALGRLADMGIEPYIIRSALTAVLAQRLLRRSCQCRSINLETQREPCQACRRTGYLGRIVVAELLTIRDQNLIQGILNRVDVQTLEQLAVQAGMTKLTDAAQAILASGKTTSSECVRVFGPDFL